MKTVNIHGRHEGETIVVLGTGPSINKVDLKKALRFTTIGVNAILEKFEPDYYLFLDEINWEKYRYHIAATRAQVFCPRHRHVPVMALGQTQEMFPFKVDVPATRFEQWAPWLDDQPILSRKYEDGLFYSATSTIAAVNLAFLFGAKRVVMLGVDLHDHSHYNDLVKGRDVQIPQKHRIMTDFERIKKDIEGLDFEILNGNPDSAVRCFPFVDLEDLATW